MTKGLLLMPMSSHGKRDPLALLLHGNNAAAVTIVAVMILAMLLLGPLAPVVPHLGPRLVAVDSKTIVAETTTTVVVSKTATTLHHLVQLPLLLGNKLHLLLIPLPPVDTVVMRPRATILAILNQIWVLLLDLLLLLG